MLRRWGCWWSPRWSKEKDFILDCEYFFGLIVLGNDGDADGGNGEVVYQKKVVKLKSYVKDGANDEGSRHIVNGHHVVSDRHVEGSLGWLNKESDFVVVIVVLGEQSILLCEVIYYGNLCPWRILRFNVKSVDIFGFGVQEFCFWEGGSRQIFDGSNWRCHHVEGALRDVKNWCLN
jgi:hypothetical protein